MGQRFGIALCLAVALAATLLLATPLPAAADPAECKLARQDTCEAVAARLAWTKEFLERDAAKAEYLTTSAATLWLKLKDPAALSEEASEGHLARFFEREGVDVSPDFYRDKSYDSTISQCYADQLREGADIAEAYAAFCAAAEARYEMISSLIRYKQRALARKTISRGCFEQFRTTLLKRGRELRCDRRDR